jgi:CRP-like cAMP-binding protein
MLTLFKRPELTERLRVLRSVSLFGELDEETLTALDSVIDWRRLEADAALFKERDPGDALFIVVEGRLDVWRKEDDTDRLMGRVFPGEPVGELALLGLGARTASVRAARDSILARLSREKFEELANSSPRFTLALCRSVAGRAVTVSPKATRRIGLVFGVIPASPGPVTERAAENLTQALTQVLGGAGARYLDSKAVTEALGSQVIGAEEARTRWLSAREAEYETLVIVADHQDSPWTQLCLRHSDVILLIADADANPGAIEVPAKLHRPIQGGFDRRELVLVHPSARSTPRGAARWRDALPVDAHHHARANHPEDFQRIARFLTGRAVSLALGGGAARGLAHIGALRIHRAGCLASVPLGAPAACHQAPGLPVGTTSRGSRSCGLRGWPAAGALARPLTAPPVPA